MARYQERFPGKSQAFLIRSAVGSDAEKLIAYMVQGNQETTFLSMEPGEFEASYPVEKEASYLDSIAQSQDRQLLIAVTPDGEIAGNCRCEYPGDRRRLRHTAVLDISVRKDYWRQGLGRRLMEIQENWCRSQGVESSVWKWTPKTCGPWGCTSAGALRWRAPCAGRRKWPTAPTGICTSWGSF